jgi:mRNA interferase MazF
MQRGEVWWAKLPSPIGRRPVVLLSRDEAYAVRNAVTVAKVTSTVRGIPVEVELGLEVGLVQRNVL